MDSTRGTPISSTLPRFEFSNLKKEWASLTEAEREDAERDVNGLNVYSVDETDEFIAEKLDELNEYIQQNIHEADREAFDLAQLICPDYVNSTKFRVMFLRSELFDIPKTATRLVTYWDKKVDLFGVDNAFRKLSLSDFTEEDQMALSLGGLRLLPYKDCFGRGIMFSNRTLWDQRSTNRSSMVKLAWYMVHAGLEDEDVQKNGMVLIFCAPVDVSGPTPKTGSSHKNYFDAYRDRLITKAFLHHLPVRWVSIHHILRVNHNILLPQFLHFLKPKLRARYKSHDGRLGLASATTYLIDFETIYGLPKNILPPDIGGTLDCNSYEMWLNERRQRNL